MTNSETAVKVLNYIRANASTEYQDRIPVAVRDNIAEVGNTILSYTPTKNQFLDILVNKIGLTLVSRNEYANRFAPFKGEPINYGDTIEDIYVDLMEAQAYNPDNTNPFGQVKPNLKVLYHKVDRELQYKVTINDALLRRAFKSAEGVNNLVTSIVDSLYTSKSYDEYIMTKHLLSGDIYGKTVYLGADTDPAVLAKNVLTQVRSLISAMGYMSTEYNKLGTNQNTPAEDLYLIIRSDVKLAIDMDVLAGVFNLDKVDINAHIIEVDNYEDATHVFSLIDGRGMRLHDVLDDAETIRNPEGKYTNYYVNHWALQSFSTYRNAVKGVTGTEPTGTTTTSK